MSIIRRPFRYRYDNAALYLIGLTVLVFALGYLYRPLKYYLALTPEAVLRGRVWQFVTYMFAHDGLRHILFNMLGLFFFGTQVERRMGSREFLLYYLLTGFLSGAFSFFIYWFIGPFGAPLLGASGALFAVELAYATFFPDSVIYIWGILPLRAPVVVLGFTGLEIFFSATGLQSGVAHLTHLAGFAFGWLYFMARFGANPGDYLFRRR
jgi:membrane associated rhomboid family serine protease